jgi:uncharacterized membrane protein YphA (DoxX/SURF4 family)
MTLEKAKTIGYWVTTGFVALDFLVGGAANIAHPPVVTATMEHLGYPGYFTLLLGTWKVLGAVALLAPRFPRLKEWAYAGIFFDLTGAAVSHGASGDGAGKVLVPLVVAAVMIASWKLRPASRTLATGSPRSSSSAETGEDTEHAGPAIKAAQLG